MQRIVCRYRYDVPCEGSYSPHNLRQYFADACGQAGLALEEGRRVLTFAPPLPHGATSDDERCCICLRDPRDPHDVRRWVNQYLPHGVRIVNTWIARPGDPDDDFSRLDAAVYQVLWRDAPPTADIDAQLKQFFAETDVLLLREREKKTQRVNVRALVYQARLGVIRPDLARLILSLSVGPQGTVRPDELLQVLGYVVNPDQLGVHRLALRSAKTYRRMVPRVGVWRRER